MMSYEEKIKALGPERTPDFGVTFNFPKNTRNPQRLLNSAGAYIDALQSLDSLLVASVDAKIKPVFVLEELETGSLRFLMKQVLEAVDDEAIKNLDWKPAVGKYLVKCKYVLLKLLEGRNTLPAREELERAAQQINALARETDVLLMPAYIPVKALDLANETKKITDALKCLEAGDSVTFHSDEEDVIMPPGFVVTQDEITELFSETSLSNEIESILMVRRPDFLGESKWDFRFEKRSVSARISDTDWISQYHAAKVDVRPGDALRVKIKETTTFDKRGEVIKQESEIVKVHDVIRMIEQYPLP